MNRFKTIVVYTVLLLTTLAAMVVIHKLGSQMNDLAEKPQHELRFSGKVNDASPAVAFTTMALGSFRGIIADVLWLRSESLKAKKSYFEMVQLARWITDLQPSYSGGTAYLAWNLAYNISVTASNHEDRWRWVNEGIALIRDKALAANPNDPMLYKELAWIYQHKLGNVLDDAHNLYKNRLAMEITGILGTGKPDWNKLAGAPADKNAFLKIYPEKTSNFFKIARECGYENYDALYKAFRSGVKAELPANFAARLSKEEFEFADNYFRARLLRDKLKLEPARIIALNGKYGSMDWRMPESLAIYWATLGVERSPGQHDLNCARLITQALQAAFRNGRLLTLDETNYKHITTVPNVALADAAYEAFLSTQNEYDAGNDFSTFRSARINFLKDAIPLIYLYGNRSKAEEFFKLLVKEDGRQRQNNLDDFIVAELSEDVRDADVKRATAIICNLIRNSLLMAVWGDHDAAVAQERLARYIYAKYSTDNRDIDRNKLAPYPSMKLAMLDELEQNGNEVIKTRIRQLKALEIAEAAEEQQQTNQTNNNRPDAVPGESKEGK